MNLWRYSFLSNLIQYIFEMLPNLFFSLLPLHHLSWCSFPRDEFIQLTDDRNHSSQHVGGKSRLIFYQMSESADSSCGLKLVSEKVGVYSWLTGGFQLLSEFSCSRKLFLLLCCYDPKNTYRITWKIFNRKHCQAIYSCTKLCLCTELYILHALHLLSKSEVYSLASGMLLKPLWAHSHNSVIRQQTLHLSFSWQLLQCSLLCRWCNVLLFF